MTGVRRFHRWLAALPIALGLALIGTLPPQLHATQPTYDPLRTTREARPVPQDLTITDPARTRTIPVLVYLPSATGAAPVILFSHGLGGSRHGAAYLGHHWSARGYVVVFLQHPGSDDTVWRDLPLRERLPALQAATSAQQHVARALDVRVVLDTLTLWTRTQGHPLHQRLDLSKVGMSGHSFGAVTTQAVSGQAGLIGQRLTDARIRAALPMSPSPPAAGTPTSAFGQVTLPWLLMTGTLDTSPINRTTVADRRLVYTALPAGGKYELVLFGARHSAFTDRDLPGDQGARDPAHHRRIEAISTAFWDAWLREDPAARTWLDGPGPRTVLDARDGWQRK
jgi:predicted dienelactone hydrolase